MRLTISTFVFGAKFAFIGNRFINLIKQNMAFFPPLWQGYSVNTIPLLYPYKSLNTVFERLLNAIFRAVSAKSASITYQYIPVHNLQ